MDRSASVSPKEMHVTLHAVSHAHLPLLQINYRAPHHHAFKIRAFGQVRDETGRRQRTRIRNEHTTSLGIIISLFY